MTIKSGLKEIRSAELDFVISRFPPNCKILEIGAGAGWQAKRLSESGFQVEAIDLKSSGYAEMRVWPVKEYDGQKIPYSDHSFDVVFTSHVLDHVKNSAEIQQEIMRVLKKGGMAIHVLPTSMWRLVTSAVHPLHLCFRLISALLNFTSSSSLTLKSPESSQIADRKCRALWRAFFPTRLGVRGNFLSEIWLFSFVCRKQFFLTMPWKSLEPIELRIFYSGHSIFGRRISVSKRVFLGKFFGGCSRAILLRSP